MPFEISGKSAECIPHSCLVKLQAVYDTLKTAEKKAADLLLDKPEFFRDATIVEAAGEAGCSEATLVRLAKKLGYGGYPELKSCLCGDRKDDPSALYAEISGNDGYGTVAQKVFRASIQALKDTLDAIDGNEYKKAVEAVANAKKIVLCGAGDAANVALSGFQKFFRAGVDVHSSPDPDIQLISVSRLSKGDVIIAISHSGKTKSIVDLVKYSKVTEATVICITNYPLSPLAKNSDIVLLTAAFAEHVKGEVMSKRVAELCLLESIFINVLLKNKESFVESLGKSNNALDVNKMR